MGAHELDNPLWQMLCHDMIEFTTGTALAKRCHPEMAPITGLADHSAAAFADIAALFDPGESAFTVEADPPYEIPGFEIQGRFSFNQLVCQQRTPALQNSVEVLELTQADLQDAIQLVDLTQPGPFFPALFARRRFVGIRQEGQLVAMAGERMQTPGFCEVSAVCTHPDWRGRGYARLLTQVVAEGIWARGETPFLHVAFGNDTAIRIYEGLGFVKRKEMTGISLVRS